MKHLPTALTLCLITAHSLLAQTSLPASARYLGHQPPGAVPIIFGPGSVSQKDLYEYGSVFSRDGQEFFYAVIINSKPQIRGMRYERNGWTAPKTIIGSDVYEYNDPFLSPDGNRLYFISDRPADGKGEKKDFDIWYIERKGTAWSEVPVNAGPNINSPKNEYYMSFTNDGTMYFSSNADSRPDQERDYNIRLSKYEKGKFQPSERLADRVNSAHYEADVFVSPDEKYLIFCAERPDGQGQGDLYISFKGPSGEWQQARNLGNAVNTEAYEFCPFVTSDGKYLFFSRGGDIYWVDAGFLTSVGSK